MKTILFLSHKVTFSVRYVYANVKTLWDNCSAFFFSFYLINKTNILSIQFVTVNNLWKKVNFTLKNKSLLLWTYVGLRAFWTYSFFNCPIWPVETVSSSLVIYYWRHGLHFTRKDRKSKRKKFFLFEMVQIKNKINIFNILVRFEKICPPPIKKN